jgi:hypothetical protein
MMEQQPVQSGITLLAPALNQRSVLTPLGQSTIAGFTFDPQTAGDLWQSVQNEAARLIKEQGLRAFEMPRPSAIAHETGHVVVAVHDGVVLSYVEISRHVVHGQTAWGGYTRWARPYPADHILVDPAIDPPRNVLLRMCGLIAGAVGEQVLDPTGCRDGSSIDEIVVSQFLAAAMCRYQHDKGRELWNRCWRRTAMIIHGNQKVAKAVAAKLDAFGIVRRKQLAKLTSKVQRLADDPLDRIIEGGRA